MQKILGYVRHNLDSTTNPFFKYCEVAKKETEVAVSVCHWDASTLASERELSLQSNKTKLKNLQLQKLNKKEEIYLRIGTTLEIGLLSS